MLRYVFITRNLNTDFNQKVYFLKNSVHTSQRTYSVTNIKPTQLMLFIEIIFAYSVKLVACPDSIQGQPAWDLWWTKSIATGFCPSTSPVTLIPPMLHSHISFIYHQQHIIISTENIFSRNSRITYENVKTRTRPQFRASNFYSRWYV
jgi:hypothetical protein